MVDFSLSLFKTPMLAAHTWDALDTCFRNRASDEAHYTLTAYLGPKYPAVAPFHVLPSMFDRARIQSAPAAMLSNRELHILAVAMVRVQNDDKLGELAWSVETNDTALHFCSAGIVALDVSHPDWDAEPGTLQDTLDTGALARAFINPAVRSHHALLDSLCRLSKVAKLAYETQRASRALYRSAERAAIDSLNVRGPARTYHPP